MGKSWHREYRCDCGKLLFKGLLVDSEVEVKCRGCKQITTVVGEEGNKLICHIGDCPNRV